MTQTATKSQPEVLQPLTGEIAESGTVLADSREWQTRHLRLLWGRRRFFLRATGVGVAISTLFAFALPKRYTATTQLMPPDAQSTSGMAMMTMAARAGAGGMGSLAGDLLGLKSSGALFIGVLRSETSQDRLIEQFDLKRVYRKTLMMDARATLDENTSISEDRKSGIITISATDKSPQRAAAIATAYVDELNSLVAKLSTSAAHRERIFLEERLKTVKQDLDDASNLLAQFSSTNNTLDIQQEGKAMLDVAANLAGQMVAAQSQLEGLRQIYTDSNPRVQSLNARVGELRKQLDKLSGTKPSSSAATSIQGSGDMPYPTIRNLPLLGVKYADYYRHAKVQETVYELLTQQFELAKVQEAKETPSVKVLDPAGVPERKSFPPRLLVMALGTFLVFSCSVVLVLGTARWNEDLEDPRRLFAQEVVASLKAHTVWGAQNGNGLSSSMQRLWNRRSNRESSEKPLHG